MPWTEEVVFRRRNILLLNTVLTFKSRPNIKKVPCLSSEDFQKISNIILFLRLYIYEYMPIFEGI